MTGHEESRAALKWYRHDAHLAVRALATINIALTLLSGRFDQYLINPVTGKLKVFAALLVVWVHICPFAFLIFVVLGLAQLGRSQRAEAEAKKEQLALFVDGAIVLAAYLLAVTYAPSYATM